MIVKYSCTLIMFLLVVGGLLYPFNAFCDQPRVRRSFSSENGNYIFKPTDTVHLEDVNGEMTERMVWSLFDTQNQKVVYSITESLSQLIAFHSVRISNDGVHLVVVNDNLATSFYPDFPAMFFYTHGKLTNKYSFGDLIDNFCSMEFTASHAFWLNYFDFDTTGFSVETKEYYRYNFDNAGNLISKKTVTGVLETDSIVSGTVFKIGKDEYQLTVKRTLRGDLKSGDIIRFKATKKYMKMIYRGNVYSFMKSNKKHVNRQYEKGRSSTYLIRDGKPIDYPYRLNSMNGC